MTKYIYLLFSLLTNAYLYLHLCKHLAMQMLSNVFMRAHVYYTYTIDRSRKNETWYRTIVKLAQTTKLDSVEMVRMWLIVAARCGMVYESNPCPKDFTCKQEWGREGLRFFRLREKNSLRFRDPQPLCVGAFSHEIPRSNYMSSLCSWNLRLYC